MKTEEQIKRVKEDLWSDEEDGKFIEGVFKYGKNYHKLAEYIGTKSYNQCKFHLLKVKLDLEEDPENNKTLLKMM